MRPQASATHDGDMMMHRSERAPLKVLITTDWYEPVVNGVVTSVLTLKKQLEMLGCDVRVLTLAESLRSSSRDGVYRLASLNASMFYDHARISVLPNRKIRREIEQWHPDVIHSQCEFSTFLWARTIAKALDIPIVHTYHTIYEDYTHYYAPTKTMGKKMITAFSKKFCEQVSAVITPTAKVERLLRGYGVTQPIAVIPTGLDLSRFHAAETSEDLERSREIRRELGIAEGTKVLLSVCRLAKEKSVDDVLRHLAKARPAETVFVLVGDGPSRNELEDLVDHLGIRDMVRFAGFRAPEEVADYYRMADLFVSASLSETQGLTFIEAMACGVPLLCRKDDSLDGVILEGKTGYTYNSSAEFAARLGDILEDDALRARMAACAAKRAASVFSAEAFGRSAKEVYEKVLASVGTGRGRSPLSLKLSTHRESVTKTPHPTPNGKERLAA